MLKNIKFTVAFLLICIINPVVYAHETCKQVAPIDKKSSMEVIYDNYISPVTTAVSYGRAIVDPAAVIPKAKMLKEIYENYATYDKGTAIYLVNNIRLLYGNSDISSLNTGMIVDELKKLTNDKTAQRLINSAMCVAPNRESSMKFEINFYALDEDSCKKMYELFSAPLTPSAILVNNVMNAKCDNGSAMSKRETKQITFVYLKTAY